MTTSVLTLPYEVVCDDSSKIERADWLALRKTGLGSSDAAPALNLSPWRSQYEVFAEKRNLIPDEADNWRFRIGRDMEPLVIAWWCELTGRDPHRLQRHVMVRSKEWPFLIANPDALEGESSDLPVIEAKTSHPMEERKWEDGVPDQYVIQGLQLMLTTGRRKCIFPVCFGFNPPREFTIYLDEYLVVDPETGESTASALLKIMGELWRRIEENDPPDPDGSESAMMAVREVYLAYEQGKSIELPDSVKALLIQRDIHVADAARATKAADAIKQQFMVMLGKEEAVIGKYLGETVFTHKPDKNGKRSFRFNPDRSF